MPNGFSKAAVGICGGFCFGDVLRRQEHADALPAICLTFLLPLLLRGQLLFHVSGIARKKDCIKRLTIKRYSAT